MTHSKTTKPGLWALTATLALVGLSGCASDSSPDEGRLVLYVKDAPVDQYEQLRVTITRAEVLPAQSAAWVVAFDGEATLDLLALQGSAAREKLAEIGIEAGRYQGLRLAISEAVGIDRNGTQRGLVVAGNVLSVLESFDIVAGQGLSLLLDIDAEASVSEDGLFEPMAGDLQSSAADADQDNVTDVEDVDDDGDGIEDAEDDDRDGDNRPDAPRQERSNLFGLCTAYFASAAAREQGMAQQNATAMQRLQENATKDGKTLDAFCDAQPFPGKADAIPAEAQQARASAQARRDDATATRGPPAGTGAPAGTGGPPGGTGGAPTGQPPRPTGTRGPPSNQTQGPP